MSQRSFGRDARTARPLDFQCDFTQNADGSVLVSTGNTKVICTAFLEDKVPGFLKNQGVGWVTAEYGMLPGATHQRTLREAAKGKQQGRTIEIQRLIGRSLRAAVNCQDLGERTIVVDCDVIQADGGTRTAAITGGCVALYLCLWKHRKKFFSPPLAGRIAAVSLGILDGLVLVDLDYEEDSTVDVDMNLVKTEAGRFIEIQGTAENRPFSQEQMMQVLEQGGSALDQIFAKQKQVLLDYGVDPSWLNR